MKSKILRVLLTIVVLTMLVIPIVVNPIEVNATGGQQQIIIGGSYSVISNSATNYNALFGGTTWDTFATTGRQVISAPGTISNFEVKLDAAAGSGAAFVITILDTTQATSLATTITNPATTATSAGSLTVVAGDIIHIQSTYTGSPATTPHATWSALFTSTNNNESWLTGWGSAGSSQTRYIPVQGNSQVLTESTVEEVIPTAGTISKLYVLLQNSPGGATNGYTIALRLTHGGSASTTALSLTIVEPNTTGNDTSHSVAVVAGDLVDVICTPVNSPSSSPTVYFGFTFTSTTMGESILMSVSSDTPTLSTTEYNYLSNGVVSTTWSGTESNRTSGGQSNVSNAIIKDLYITLASTSSGSYVITVRNGSGNVGTPSTLSVTITAGNLTGSDTSDSYTMADYDILDVSCAALGTAVALNWSVVIDINTATAPTVTTTNPVATSLYTTQVTLNGNITSTGGDNPTVRGFKYGLTQADTWDAHDTSSYSTGAFTKSITSLSSNTQYYARAYATNAEGTSYGSYVSFTTVASNITKTASPILISSLISGIGTGDGTILYNGYLYAVARSSGAYVMKMDTATYTPTVVQDTYQSVFGPGGDALVESAGSDGNPYLWCGGFDTVDGNLYQLDPTTLAIVNAYTIWSTGTYKNIWAITADATNIYMGTESSGVNSMRVASFNKTTHAVTLNTLSFGSSTEYFHSMVQDGSYLYGHTVYNSTSGHTYKIQKSDLTLTSSASFNANFAHEDIFQDTNYFYLQEDTVKKIAKADLTETDLLIPDLTNYMDGKDVLVDGRIITSDTTSGTSATLFLIASNFTYSNGITLSGLQADTNAHINKLFVDGSVLHVMTDRTSGTTVRFYKFNLSDITGGGTTYYVDSASGSDSNNGTSPATAWQTLDRVNTALSSTIVAGDTILFKKGQTFATGSTVSVGVSGSAGLPIIFDAYGSGANPILDCTGGGSNSFSMNNKSYLTFQNLTIKGGSARSFYIYNGSNNININHVTVTNSPLGVYILTGTPHDITIDNFTCTGGTNGISANTVTSLANLTISNCTFTGHSDAGISIATSVTNTGVTISNTVSSSNGNRGMIIGTCSGLIFSGNTCNSNTSEGTYIYSSPNVIVSNYTGNSNTKNGLRVYGCNTGTFTNITTNANSYNGQWYEGSATANGHFIINGWTSNNNTGSSNGVEINGLDGLITDVLLENGTATGNAVNGIQILNICTSITCSYNTIYLNLNDGCGVENTGSSIIFDHNTIYSNGVNGLSGDGDGISFHDSSSGTIRYNNIHDNKKSAVCHITSGTVNHYYNLMYSATNGTLGLASVGFGSGTYTFYNNVFYSSGKTGYGFYLSPTLGNTTVVTLKNNIVSNLGTGIYYDGTGTLTYVGNYNCVYGNTTAYTGVVGGANDVTANPKLTNPPTSFVLLGGSPCINAGINVGLTLDYAGKSVSNPPEIGAYELPMTQGAILLTTLLPVEVAALVIIAAIVGLIIGLRKGLDVRMMLLICGSVIIGVIMFLIVYAMMGAIS